MAMGPGYGGSTQSWAEILRDRGLAAPLAAVGAFGLKSALDQVFPTTEQQRCWNHRALILPKQLQEEARRHLKGSAVTEGV